MVPFNEDSDISASDPEGLGSESKVPGSVPDEVCAAIVSLSFSIKAGVTYAMNADQSRFGSELFWGGGVLQATVLVLGGPLDRVASVGDQGTQG